MRQQSPKEIMISSGGIAVLNARNTRQIDMRAIEKAEKVAEMVLAETGAFDLLDALQILLGDNPSVQGGVCQYCGRDYLEDDETAIITGECESDDCPSFVARVAIAKATCQQPTNTGEPQCQN